MRQPTICWLLYGPATTGVDPRPARAANAFDSLFPDDRLQHALRPGATAERLIHREAWLAETLACADQARLHNGRDDDRFVQLAWSRWPAAASPGHLARVVLRLDVPAFDAYLQAAAALTLRLVEAVLPWHGIVLTCGYASALEGCTLDLPRRNPLVPLRFAWMNVWSPATCAIIGFRPFDERLFASALRTRDGTRVLALTSAPLEPDANPAHRDALRAVRVRFPKVGA
jgi:hypothetical protein